MNSLLFVLAIFYTPTLTHSNVENGKYRVTSYVHGFEALANKHYVRVLKISETEFTVMQDIDGPYYIGTINKDTFTLDYGTMFFGLIHSKTKFEGVSLLGPGAMIIYRFERVGPTFFNTARREFNLGD
jgi:hypothetical protein